MNMDTVATLGLMGQMTESSVSVNTTNEQDIGVSGDVYVTFKLAKKHSFTHRFVVCHRLSRPFILGEDFL